MARASLVIEVLMAYGATRRSLHRVELPSLVAELRPSGSTQSGPGDRVRHHEIAVRLGFAVQRTLRLLPSDGACLVRSLVLVKLLGRRGISALLVIGVRSEPSFAAHAWVEHCGHHLLPTEATYRRLAEL
jgi:Transglutaminase-like superfamily